MHSGCENAMRRAQYGRLPCCAHGAHLDACGRAGVVLTCGKDNLLKLVDPRTFQAGRPPGHSGSVLMLAMCGSPAVLSLG